MEESKKPNSALRDDNNEIIGNIPSELLIRSNITIIAVLAIILCLSVFVHTVGQLYYVAGQCAKLVPRINV